MDLVLFYEGKRSGSVALENTCSSEIGKTLVQLKKDGCRVYQFILNQEVADDEEAVSFFRSGYDRALQKMQHAAQKESDSA